MNEKNRTRLKLELLDELVEYAREALHFPIDDAYVTQEKIRAALRRYDIFDGDQPLPDGMVVTVRHPMRDAFLSSYTWKYEATIIGFCPATPDSPAGYNVVIDSDGDIHPDNSNTTFVLEDWIE
jgi:hypothetical protein